MTIHIPKPTVEEAWMTMWSHFSQPGATLSKDEGGWCRYRDGTGAKCAVGCLIPDDAYDPDMEENTVDGLLPDFPQFTGWSSDRELVTFLTVAQRWHDSAKHVEGFLERLQRIKP